MIKSGGIKIFIFEFLLNLEALVLIYSACQCCFCDEKTVIEVLSRSALSKLVVVGGLRDSHVNIPHESRNGSAVGNNVKQVPKALHKGNR